MKLQTRTSKELTAALYEMNAGEENYVREIAKRTELPISANAQSVLRLIFDEQEPRYALETIDISSRLANTRPATLANKPEISAEEDELNVFSFNVYPNPFESNLTVELVGLDAATINVRDISGKLVLQIDVNADKQIVQTVNLSSGLYFIELRSKNELLDVKRIVKQ
jgi:hypothetical protein